MSIWKRVRAELRINPGFLVAVGSILILLAAAFLVDRARFDFQDQMYVTVKVSQEYGHGSGVLIAPDVVLTNAHVVEGDRNVEVKLHTGEIITGKVVWASEQNLPGTDLAIVKLNRIVTASRKLPDISCSLPAVGSALTVIGHPMMTEWTVTKGYVASIRPSSGDFADEEQTGNYFYMDVTVLPGNSGGPVFDSRGRLIGLVQAVVVVSSGWDEGSISALSIAVSGPAMCKALART
jgi:S1-C subfamily serine protease